MISDLHSAKKEDRMPIQRDRGAAMILMIFLLGVCVMPTAKGMAWAFQEFVNVFKGQLRRVFSTPVRKCCPDRFLPLETRDIVTAEAAVLTDGTPGNKLLEHAEAIVFVNLA